MSPETVRTITTSGYAGKIERDFAEHINVVRLGEAEEVPQRRDMDVLRLQLGSQLRACLAIHPQCEQVFWLGDVKTANGLARLLSVLLEQDPAAVGEANILLAIADDHR